MKKIAFVLAAAGLMSVAACSKPAETATNNEADMAVMDNSADNMEMTTDNAVDTSSNAMDSNATASNM